MKFIYVCVYTFKVVYSDFLSLSIIGSQAAGVLRHVLSAWRGLHKQISPANGVLRQRS